MQLNPLPACGCSNPQTKCARVTESKKKSREKIIYIQYTVPTHMYVIMYVYIYIYISSYIGLSLFGLYILTSLTRVSLSKPCVNYKASPTPIATRTHPQAYQRWMIANGSTDRKFPSRGVIQYVSISLHRQLLIG